MAHFADTDPWVIRDFAKRLRRFVDNNTAALTQGIRDMEGCRNQWSDSAFEALLERLKTQLSALNEANRFLIDTADSCEREAQFLEESRRQMKAGF